MRWRQAIRKGVGLWLSIELTSAIVALCLLVAALPAYVTVWVFRMLGVAPSGVPDGIIIVMLAAGIVIAIGLGRIGLRIPRDLWREAIDKHAEASLNDGGALKEERGGDKIQ